MFKTCDKLVYLLRKNCGKLCKKGWVNFIDFFYVGKSTTFFTVLPTRFLQAFSTHSPLLKPTLSPISTVPITTIKYIIRKD